MRAVLLKPAALAAAIAIVAGCARDATPAHDEGALVRGASGHASVSYQPEVRIAERDAGLAALLGVSTDGSTLVFDAGAPPFSDLEVGDVLFIKGLSAWKVLALERSGSEVAILTNRATIGEVVREGRIQVDASVRFTGASANRSSLTHDFAWLRMLDPRVREAWAQAPGAERLNKAIAEGRAEGNRRLVKNAVKGVFEGWETTFQAVPEAGKLNVSIRMTKNVGGFVALVTGEGYLADFDFQSDLQIGSGVVEQLKLMHKKLNGAMNFDWEVAKDSPGPLSESDRIRLPAALSIPLYRYLDGMPLYLDVTSAIILKPAISGGKEYSHGAFRVTYDGTQSFQVKKGNLDADGNMSGDIEFLEGRNISAVAPMGMVVAFAAPRIELSFGTTKIMKFSPEMRKAAEVVDAVARRLVGGLYGQKGLDRLAGSPMGGFSWGKAMDDALSSDATAFIELVTSSGMSHSGMSVLTPCTRTDLHMDVTVGVSAQVLGQKLGKSNEQVFEKDIERVEPPGAGLCENIG